MHGNWRWYCYCREHLGNFSIKKVRIKGSITTRPRNTMYGHIFKRTGNSLVKLCIRMFIIELFLRAKGRNTWMNKQFVLDPYNRMLFSQKKGRIYNSISCLKLMIMFMIHWFKNGKNEMSFPSYFLVLLMSYFLVFFSLWQHVTKAM